MPQPALDVESNAERTFSTLRVLLVPDSIHWITGTIARSIVAYNEWIEGTIISGHVLDIVAGDNPHFFDAFDLVHFVCPYASRKWLPVLGDLLPCVTSHHHVSDDWELQRHNLAGDAIIVGSQQWANDVAERGASPERIVCVPYGVDASRFLPPSSDERHATRQALGISDKSVVVGFFAKKSSNEQDRKGTDVFASAVQQLHRMLPSLVILIIGPGWDELLDHLSNAGINCIWRPFVRDAADMPKMYQALDFYWVTARVEGGPVTLLEAMSTALCCITTPVGLAREIVESGANGVIVPLNDANAFAVQTAHFALATKERTALGAAARDTILQTMDVPVTARKVRIAYEVALAHFRGRNSTPHEHREYGEHARHRAVLSPSLLARVSMLEQLTWAEALMLQGQRPLAFRLIFESWGKYPFSTLPPRFLLRNALPERLVRAIVRVKLGVAGVR
ncbi:MAG: glycosyltransferase family 4 protein [Chthoniobacterales bacterium]|nr:glycosyltransferase family 4 protein [Chthoniobacterales bacterium]